MERIRDIIEKSKEAAKLQEDKYDEEVRKLNDQMDALRNERNQAAKAKREFALISKLGEKGSKEIWEQLFEERKFEKEVLLAVFSSKDIPQALNLEQWNTNAPEHLKEDREILIARSSAYENDYRWLPNPRFLIPDPLVGDLEVLRAVAKPSPRALQNPGIPDTMFDDDELFRAFVDRKPLEYALCKDPLHPILKRFSCRIRSDVPFMLQAAEIGLNVFPCIAGDLLSDKEFCLKLTQISVLDVPDDALTYCSDSLKADREVVLSFVQKNGMTLKDAADRHRQDVEIVRAASENKAAALVHGLGLVRKQLSGDKEFIQHILQKRSPYSDACPDFFAMLDADLKVDREIIFIARERKCFDASALPDELSQDPQFWKGVLGESSLFWNDLPEELKHDISFARCITGFHDVDTVKDVLEVHPALSSDAEYWCNSILCGDLEFGDEEIVELINEVGSELRNNRDVMLHACSITEQVLQELPEDFMLDREFVATTVENSDYALWCLPFEAQLLYPDLVALAISKFSAIEDLEECVDNVNPELWSNLTVAEAWFSDQGPIHDEIPDRLREDPDYCMLVVEFCPHHEADEFISPSLKANKDFMLRAIKKNPLAYLLAEGDLEMDYDVSLAGFGDSDSDELVEAMIGLENDRAFAYLHSFSDEVQRKLQLHESLLTLLFGMSSFSGSGCRLPKLQQGKETTLLMKQRIADYLGAPIGHELAQHRRAAEALQQIPHPDDDLMDMPVELLPMGFRMFLEMAHAMQD